MVAWEEEVFLRRQSHGRASIFWWQKRTNVYSNSNAPTHFVRACPFGSKRTQKSAQRADPNGRASAFHPPADPFSA